MMYSPKKQELLARIESLYNILNANSTDWDAAFIVTTVIIVTVRINTGFTL